MCCFLLKVSGKAYQGEKKFPAINVTESLNALKTVILYHTKKKSHRKLRSAICFHLPTNSRASSPPQKQSKSTEIKTPKLVIFRTCFGFLKTCRKRLVAAQRKTRENCGRSRKYAHKSVVSRKKAGWFTAAFLNFDRFQSLQWRGERVGVIKWEKWLIRRFSHNNKQRKTDKTSNK